MAKSKLHVGLEIGTSTTRIVVAEVKPDHSVKILGIGKTKTAGVRKGEIQDFNQTRICIKQALLEAEDQSDVKIMSVFLAVTGGHIRGINNRGTYRLPPDITDITNEHVMEVEDIACDTSIPGDHGFIHTLSRYYKLDGQEHRVPPIGLMGNTIEADFHLVHGIESRIKNTLKVVRDCAADIEDIVFAPIASAQVALSRESKDAGALVIDMGGGTTDYALYLNGAIFSSGCIPIGGDHIQNDIHLVTHLPLSKAENIKVQYGDLTGTPESLSGKITLDDDIGLNKVEIERELLNKVISARIEEILMHLKSRLPEGVTPHIGTGVYLCGGVSKTRGISRIVEKVFQLPVNTPAQSDLSGNTAYFRDPQLFTALGLIRYAQYLDQEDSHSSEGGRSLFDIILGKK